MIEPYKWSKEEIGAIQALYAHDAGRFVLDLIVHRLGMLQAMSFSADPCTTAFQEGRRYVAGCLNNAITMPLAELKKEEPDESRNRTLTATERAALATAGQYAGPGRGPKR